MSLRGRREFALAMRRGAVAHSPALTVYAFLPRAAQQNKPKVGVVVSRKVGNAVERNRVRRRCKAILEMLLDPSDARWYVIAFKPSAAAIGFAELRRQLDRAMPKAGKPRKRAS